MVTADAFMTNAGVFLGDLSKCCWERDTRAAGPLADCPPCQEPAMAAWKALTFSSAKVTAPGKHSQVLHTFLSLYGSDIARERQCQIQQGALVWASLQPHCEWGDLKCQPLYAVIRCAEHLLQPSLGVFIAKPTLVIEARIALMPCCLAYPAQKTIFFFLNEHGILHWLVWNVSLLDLNQIGGPALQLSELQLEIRDFNAE